MNSNDSRALGSVLRTLAACSTALALTACGGGDDDFKIEFHSFSITPSTLTIPTSGTQPFTIAWRSSSSGATAATYSLSAYALRTGTSDQIASTTRFWQNGCSMTSPCSSSTTRTDNCTIDATGRVTCAFPNGVTLRDLVRGSYRVIARACGVDSHLNEVCVDSSAVDLTVN
jgi:hypothetical protein